MTTEGARTLVMTGASRGIGRVAAENMLREDRALHLVALTRTAGDRRLKDELVAATRNDHVVVLDCDLASLADVRAACGRITELLSAQRLPVSEASSGTPVCS